MLHFKIDRSPDAGAACARLLDELGVWVGDCVREFADAPATDCHDQGTYTTAWAPWIATHADSGVMDFLRVQRDRIRDHFAGTGQWEHGYWTMQEAHHGTEHYELFLGALWRLDPEDVETVAQLVDAAEHLGNWVPSVPPWFDWETGLFRSMHFGIHGVWEDPGETINTAEHFRCINISLLALGMTGDPRYLALARAHGSRWAAAILTGESLPVGLLPDGPVYALVGETERMYRAFAGMAGVLDDPVECTENLLASGAVGALLRLWSLTGEGDYRAAAERLLDVLATQLADPDAGAAADAIRDYRRTTGDTRYDAQVLAAAETMHPWGFEVLSFEPQVRRAVRPRGIGKRSDVPDWFEDGAPRRCGSILLGLAAEITQNDRLATAALDLARAHFTLARQAFPHGRDHGCAANTISAIARGHGRENHAGMITAVLQPLLPVFGR
ncbi:MAG: hypothetical protein ACYC6A_05320 [Armatimonadota bacterium]